MNRTEHLLTILAEEANEVAHRAAKALRFGLTEVQSGQDKTNADRIVGELADLLGVVMMMQNEGLLPKTDQSAIAAKPARVERYLEYSALCGTLSTPSVSALPSDDDEQVRVDERVFTLDRVCKWLAANGHAEAAKAAFEQRLRFFLPERAAEFEAKLHDALADVATETGSVST